MTNFDNFEFLPVAEISVSKLKRNMQSVLQRLHGKKLIAVVKSNAYGHGMEIARYMQNYCDAFAVSRLSEAIELRFLGIEKPIMSLIPFGLEEVKVAINYSIQLCVHSYEYLQALCKMNLANEILINFSVDSGMKRLGFSDENVFYDALKLVSKCQNIIPCGIYSHFSNAESENCCNTQFAVFNRFLKLYDEKFDGIRHISASGGLISGGANGKFNLDAVRCGILLYGYKPFKSNFSVEPIMRVIAPQISSRTFSNENCLYNSFCENGEYSLVNYGYADGLPRNAIPKRCMDLSYVKGTGTVVVMDNATEIARQNGTIEYEVLTHLANRIKKIYIGDI